MSISGPQREATPPTIFCRKHGEQAAVVRDVHIVGVGPAPRKNADCPKCLEAPFEGPFEGCSPEAIAKFMKPIKPGMYVEVSLCEPTTEAET